MKTASASGSCSACATRSAAINAARRARSEPPPPSGPPENQCRNRKATISSPPSQTGSRPHDLVYPRNAFRAIRQRGDRLRSANAVEFTHAEKMPRPPASPAPGGAKPRGFPSRRRPARESPSSARLRAADSGRRARNIRRTATAAPTGPPGCRTSRPHPIGGICHSQNCLMLPRRLLQGGLRNVRSDHACSAACHFAVRRPEAAVHGAEPVPLLRVPAKRLVAIPPHVVAQSAALASPRASSPAPRAFQLFARSASAARPARIRITAPPCSADIPQCPRRLRPSAAE